jgi:hypothetical protein
MTVHVVSSERRVQRLPVHGAGDTIERSGIGHPFPRFKAMLSR